MSYSSSHASTASLQQFRASACLLDQAVLPLQCRLPAYAPLPASRGSSGQPGKVSKKPLTIEEPGHRHSMYLH